MPTLILEAEQGAKDAFGADILTTVATVSSLAQATALKVPVVNNYLHDHRHDIGQACKRVKI